MADRKKPTFCKGCGWRFDERHKHHAKGYCYNEYRKVWRAAQTIPPMPKLVRVCKADGLPFDQDHKHYALGRCRYGYLRHKAGKPEGPHYCKTHNRPCFFPDEQAPRVFTENGICDRCHEIIKNKA